MCVWGGGGGGGREGCVEQPTLTYALDAVVYHIVSMTLKRNILQPVNAGDELSDHSDRINRFSKTGR